MAIDPEMKLADTNRTQVTFVVLHSEFAKARSLLVEGLTYESIIFELTAESKTIISPDR